MDVRGLFDALYDKMVLRDVFGKVVPGLALIAAVLASLLGLDVIDSLLTKMTTVLWVFVIGFSWLVGFALQNLGEVCRVLRTHPYGPDRQETRDTFHTKWAEFHEVATSIEHVHAERLNIIKEACGNAAVSIVCGLASALFAVFVRGTDSWYPLVPFVLLGFALALLLWRMHVIHVERYGTFVRNTLRYRSKNSEGSEVAHSGT